MNSVTRSPMTLDLRRRRRSPGVRMLTGLLIGAAVLGPLRLTTSAAAPASFATLPDDLAPRASERVRPIAVEDVNGKIGQENLWRLVDGDPSTSVEAWTPTAIRMTFATPVTVDALGALGARGGVVTLLGPQGTNDPKIAPKIDALESGAGEPRWTRVSVTTPVSSRTFVLQWSPRRPGAALPEIEVWGRPEGTGAVFPAGDDAMADGLHSGLPAGALVFDAAQSEQTIAASASAEARTFSVKLGVDPRAIERTFLVYGLTGLPHFTAARRAINGGSVVGGFGVVRGASGGLQVEEISPSALRAGSNAFRFDPSPADDPVGYRVSQLRLVTITTSSARAASDGNDLTDGKESTGWDSRKDSIKRWQFGGLTQPHELAFRLIRGQEGSLLVTGGTGLRRERVTVDLSGLKPGWHRVALDTLPAVESLSASLEGGRETGIFLSEAGITGSPLPGGPQKALRVTFPLHGECVDHQVHVRGLVRDPLDAVTAKGLAAPHLSFEPGGFNFTASEAQLGGTAGKAFSFTLETRAKTGARDKAEIKIAGCEDRAPVAVKGSAGPVEDVGAPYGVTVSPNRDTELTFAGAKVAVPAGAVDADLRLTMRQLAPKDVPPLDAGMTNVTTGGHAFRLGPHGMTFKKPLALTLPIDRTRLEPGEQPHTYYYDENDRKWREVELLAVRAKEVVAETTHFTDFITATMTLPEHPGLQSMNPTSLKNIKLADPGAGVTQIAPPEPNNKGTANLSYPIEIPPGRHHMQPDLAITYDSSAGNGWLGVGWNLSISNIEIDTRFGVPKYDGSSERYLLDGEELVRLTSTPAGAPAGGTYYARRHEGSFDWIQRLGNLPNGFSWVVTDKNGTKYTYGTIARVAKDNAHIFRWYIESAVDIWGNTINYGYIDGSGTLPGSSERFQQLIPFLVEYAGTASLSPQYKIALNTISTRGDAFSTGRPGFLVVNNVLLDNIQVLDGNNIVRKYQFGYTPHEFGKSLLDSISLFGQGGGGTALAKHTMTYNKMPVGSDGNPQYFGAPVPFSADVNGDGTPATQTTLNDSTVQTLGHSTAAGVAAFNTNASISGTLTQNVRSRIDVDGDGLPDVLPFGSTNGMQQQLDVNTSATPDALGSTVARTFPDWVGPYETDLNTYISTGYNLVTTGSTVFGNISEAGQIVADVNGDGLADRVFRSSPSGLLSATGAIDMLLDATGLNTPLDKISVRLNPGKFQSWPAWMTFTGYTGLGTKFDCTQILSSIGHDIFSAVNPVSFSSTVPTVDFVTKFDAPLSGNAHIKGGLQRPSDQAGGNGMTATIFLARGSATTTLWQHDVAANDVSTCVPLFTPGAVGSGCDSSGKGSALALQQGDRIYSRLNAKGDPDHDVATWDLTVEYDAPALMPTSDINAREPWGAYRYRFSEANDQRQMGQFVAPWVAPADGTIVVSTDLTKYASTDTADVRVMK